jgi:phosphoglycolate phosphatase-like HAD superfamily hydrolase
VAVSFAAAVAVAAVAVAAGVAVSSYARLMIRAVIVDVDDTLCMTEEASFHLENEVLTQMGRPPMSRALHLSTWGEPLLEAMAHRSPGVDVDRFAALFPPMHQRYLADGKLDVIPPENLAALDHLLHEGRTIMLLTSRAGPEVRHLLEPDHALATRVTGAYHRNNTRYTKPDPRVFDELLTETSLDPADCVYIGDSPGDAIAAGGAGIHFIACLQSGVRRLEEFDPRYVTAAVDSFPDIPPVIAEL